MAIEDHQLDKAESLYNKALELVPGHDQAWHELDSIQQQREKQGKSDP